MNAAAHPLETEVVIVGAGPVGLFAVFQCGMLKMRCHVVDALEAIGGQCSALYPEKPIYDIPAFPKIEALELIERLEEQAAPFHPIYHLGQQVVAVTRLADDRFQVETSAGTTILCRAVIVAAGDGMHGLHQAAARENVELLKPAADGKNRLARRNAALEQGPGAGVTVDVQRQALARNRAAVALRVDVAQAPGEQQAIHARQQGVERRLRAEIGDWQRQGTTVEQRLEILLPHGQFEKLGRALVLGPGAGHDPDDRGAGTVGHRHQKPGRWNSASGRATP